MPHQFKIGMTNPVTDGGLRSSKEVVDDSDFMTKEHKAVHQVRSNEAGATGDKDSLALGRRQEPHRREPR